MGGPYWKETREFVVAGYGEKIVIGIFHPKRLILSGWISDSEGKGNEKGDSEKWVKVFLQ